MKPTESFSMRWFYSAEPVYENPFACVANLIEIDGRVVVPSGGTLLFLRPDGILDASVEIEEGTWGSPVLTFGKKVATACLDNAVALVEPATCKVSVGTLAASASTPILPRPDGGLLLGIGSYECAVVCLDPHLGTRWLRVVGTNECLRHALALAGDGSLWVPTDEGLLRLQGDSGELIARSDPKAIFACVSNPVAGDSSALVAVAFRDGQCALVRVSADGSIAIVRSLPSLMRGHAIADGAGGVWLAGSSVDWQEPRSGIDYVWIARIGADGTVRFSHKFTPHTAVSLALDRSSRAWVGTYTYDVQGERGELYGLTSGGELRWCWRLEDPPSGIGAPLFLGSGQGVIPTSNGVAGFELESALRA